MSSPAVTVLTQAAPAYEFNAAPGTVKRVATSGDIDGGTLTLQHRVVPTDEWVDNPNIVAEADTHLAGTLEIVAVFNRLIVLTPGAGAAVSVSI